MTTATAEKLTERVELFHGEALATLLGIDAETFDAVVTDPPYSSGGFTRGDRAGQSVAAKYVQTGSERWAGTDFAGDNRDQRGWFHWCALWLSECLRVTKPGGYLLMFTDWRQLPQATDAVQAGGWVWRGVLSWDKGPSARAAAPHYFRHQCEYVVWATRGACPGFPDWPPPGKGCYPGSYSIPVTQADKHHPTGKPTDLLRDLVRIVPPDGRILDPFAGSGTTGDAAEAEGRRATLIETTAEFCEVIRRRMRGERLSVRQGKAAGGASLFDQIDQQGAA